MTTRDDIDALAGEYVLGTLEHAERTAVAARRLREADLDAAIGAWERRLAPLDLATRDVAPPKGLFDRIEQRIAQPAASVVSLAAFEAAKRTASRWRATALAASVAAAGLLVTLGWREAAVRDQQQQTFVAVFAKDDVLPQFYMTIDLKTRQLTVRPVDAQTQAGKTYQLWIASDQLGPNPQSLGLMDAGLAPTTKTLGYDPSLLQRATFGVSLEPSGGSPTGRPTSPALHAKLLPVAR